MSNKIRILTILLPIFLIAGCGDSPWNDPYPAADADSNTVYSSFDERPKHLDPARSYSANEYAFLAQIYEPPLQYHFLLRPYRLVPLSAAEVPVARYFDAAGNPLPEDAPAADIARSDYLIRIQPGMRFQPHPAFARDAEGRFRYHALTAADLDGINRLADFPEVGTRELTAEDFVHQIKRLAAPWLHSPIAGVMGQHIVGFQELAGQLESAAGQGPLEQAETLRQSSLAGVEAVDRDHFRISLKGKYPQFAYWLAMPFFAPMPWEAEVFYAQPGLAERNITLDWYPVGSGPFFLSENNPNLRMVLERNPNFHGESFPTEGMPGDAESGILTDAGKPLPFIDRAVYSLEKESIPRWNKFLQGYYDSSGIASDAFDQAVQIDVEGEPILTDAMREQGISLLTSVEPSSFYLGFNMLDPVIGGDSPRARLLRRAISIALDYEEFISIFTNGRGVVAQGPIPPGIFGHREGEAGINPFVYEWRDGRPVRRSLDEAKVLMEQAGYPNGIERETGRTLTINYEAVATGPDDRARLNWIRKQFAKLGIDLVIRSTDYNRFQDKLRNGTGQVFMFGWNADYPDPENFLFLLYGPNGKVEHQGENATNYANPEFDRLFDEMKFMDDGPERQAILDRLVEIARTDAPWIWGFHPKAFSLHHQWMANASPNQMANNTLKYRRIDPELRKQKRQDWNQPVLWPLWVGAGLLVALVLPAWWLVRRRERRTAL
ncbi:ABC transporter substrate-binding protein [Thiocystis violascens]|uniref:ABC-type dipeptide transport system, periplasmic component n=1 Tax=Thiocystis violascens (strain ATCC 17096 / DSM 198 / 6111) TaxID=765911 RepID=I3Y7H1_THIV6|nr:ABC transporter substrate-binding protein [Thiocystis violascens]AFL72939.1 ABC-type dipeptide transport system, periplasmic component [Thiocystis violascens DSM 198]